MEVPAAVPVVVLAAALQGEEGAGADSRSGCRTVAAVVAEATRRRTERQKEQKGKRKVLDANSLWRARRTVMPMPMAPPGLVREPRPRPMAAEARATRAPTTTTPTVTVAGPVIIIKTLAGRKAPAPVPAGDDLEGRGGAARGGQRSLLLLLLLLSRSSHKD